LPPPAWSTSSAAAAARAPRISRASPPLSRTWRPRRAGAAAATRFSGLEPFEIGPDTFCDDRERTNVTGSARFVVSSRPATTRARRRRPEQVSWRGNLLDVNMDADCSTASSEMTTFLNLIATEP